MLGRRSWRGGMAGSTFPMARRARFDRRPVVSAIGQDVRRSSRPTTALRAAGRTTRPWSRTSRRSETARRSQEGRTPRYRARGRRALRLDDAGGQVPLVVWACRCRACLQIDGLDLTFVFHAGPLVIRSIAGRQELVGPEVVMAHRPLKTRAADLAGHGALALIPPCDGSLRCADRRHPPAHRDLRAHPPVHARVHPLRERDETRGRACRAMVRSYSPRIQAFSSTLLSRYVTKTATPR